MVDFCLFFLTGFLPATRQRAMPTGKITVTKTPNPGTDFVKIGSLVAASVPPSHDG
jgi:hypothetical protein